MVQKTNKLIQLVYMVDKWIIMNIVCDSHCSTSLDVIKLSYVPHQPVLQARVHCQQQLMELGVLIGIVKYYCVIFLANFGIWNWQYYD